jgi:hypothetical protein
MACEQLVRLSEKSDVEGDLDLELIDFCFLVIQSEPDKMNPTLAEELYRHYLVIKELFDKDYEQTRTKIHRLHEGRRALRSYVNKGLKSEPRNLFRDI